MTRFIVTLTDSKDSFEMDYRGTSEDAVRGMAAADWPGFTVASVKAA